LESQNHDREKENLRKSTSSDNMLVLKGVKFIPCKSIPDPPVHSPSAIPTVQLINLLPKDHRHQPVSSGPKIQPGIQ